MCKLILLPGMDGSGIMFESLIQHIPEQCVYEVIALNQSGDQSYTAQAKAILNQIGDEQVILFAESYSGYIAWLIANLKPQNVKHIIFAASFLSNPSNLTRLGSLLPSSLLKLYFAPKSLINYLCFSNQAKPETFDMLSRSLNSVCPSVLRQRLKNMSNLPKERIQIEIPCTYIKPNNDCLVSKQAIDHITRSCINLNVVTLQGGHFIAQSNAQGCVEAIKGVIDL